MSEEASKTDYDLFRELEARHRAHFDRVVDDFRAVGSQYALLIFRQLALLNGGALVAIAPIASLLEEVEMGVLGTAAASFTLGLVAMMVASYASHLNFMLVSSSLENERNIRIQESYAIIVDCKHSDELPKPTPYRPKAIWLSFWAAHLFGWASLAGFCCGAYTLIGATQ